MAWGLPRVLVVERTYPGQCRRHERHGFDPEFRDHKEAVAAHSRILTLENPLGEKKPAAATAAAARVASAMSWEGYKFHREWRSGTD